MIYAFQTTELGIYALASYSQGKSYRASNNGHKLDLTEVHLAILMAALPNGVQTWTRLDEMRTQLINLAQTFSLPTSSFSDKYIQLEHAFLLKLLREITPSTLMEVIIDPDSDFSLKLTVPFSQIKKQRPYIDEKEVLISIYTRGSYRLASHDSNLELRIQ